jgi:hypothetical protein
MDITGISGSVSRSFDKQSFGAAVVGKTLDYMNGGSASNAQPFDKETFGAAVVSKTLDTMNANTHRYQNRNQSSYSFQQDVLMPVYTGRGTILDSMG